MFRLRDNDVVNTPKEQSQAFFHPILSYPWLRKFPLFVSQFRVAALFGDAEHERARYLFESEISQEKRRELELQVEIESNKDERDVGG